MYCAVYCIVLYCCIAVLRCIALYGAVLLYCYSVGAGQGSVAVLGSIQQYSTIYCCIEYSPLYSIYTAYRRYSRTHGRSTVLTCDPRASGLAAPRLQKQANQPLSAALRRRRQDASASSAGDAPGLAAPVSETGEASPTGKATASTAAAKKAAKAAAKGK